MESKSAPLKAIRILNLGGSWLARVAAMLLTNRRAQVLETEREVLETERAGYESRFQHAVFAGDKELSGPNLRSLDEQERAMVRARSADIVFDRLAACWHPEAPRSS